MQTIKFDDQEDHGDEKNQKMDGFYRRNANPYYAGKELDYQDDYNHLFSSSSYEQGRQSSHHVDAVTITLTALLDPPPTFIWKLMSVNEKTTNLSSKMKLAMSHKTRPGSPFLSSMSALGTNKLLAGSLYVTVTRCIHEYILFTK